MPNPATSCPPVIIDPQLFMAARRGDSKQLKDLLQIKDDDDEQQVTRNWLTATTAVGMSVAAADVIVEVDPRPPDAVDAPPSSRPPPPAGASPSFTVPLAEDGVTVEGDSLLHVVAECGDGEEFLHCARMIVCDKEKKGGDAARRLVLQARNSKGDTPLHCAAAAGNADMISCLVDLANTDNAAEVKALVRMQNDRGETALHQAVRAAENKLGCIDQLMAVDPELACVPHKGTSPLYLAISLGEMKIARHLLDTSKGKLSYSGPGGRNVLHAAVPRGPALALVLEWLRGARTATSETGDMQEQEDQREQHVAVAAAAADLLSQLMKQRDSKHGSTPLHLAASLDGWDWFPVAGFLSRPIWSGSRSATTLLLDANISTAYMVDDEGSYPIHVAAHAGSLGVVRMLLQRCPDCATLRDGSKGRTFLHVAATMGRYSVVKHVCKMPDLSSILNAQDRNGDTALHSAIRAGNLAVFNCLFRNRQVRLDVPNKEALTPLDLSWSMIPSSAFHYVFNARHTIRLSLLHAGAPYGGCRPELFREIHMAKRDVEKESEKLTDVTQVMSIVAVLIATVTFASAFTLPGGYRADGTPTLAGTGSYSFGAFVLADTLAFICSCVATFSLVYAGLPHLDISTRKNFFDTSKILLLSAGRSFVAAFALGLYLVLAPVNHTIAIAVCVIIFASLLWGNKRAFYVTCLANTVLARIGIRPTALFSYAQGIFFCILVHFGSYIIIFGLPAIHKWTR